MPFGKYLKIARMNCNMTQEDLAEKVGVTKGAIGNYESDISSPKETILIKLMEVLNVDANYLYQDFIQIRNSLSSDELRMLSAYRSADDTARQYALETLLNHPREKDDSEPSAI